MVALPCVTKVILPLLSTVAISGWSLLKVQSRSAREAIVAVVVTVGDTVTVSCGEPCTISVPKLTPVTA